MAESKRSVTESLARRRGKLFVEKVFPMKIRALLAATAVLSTVPLAAPAYADTVSPEVQAALNAYCDSLVPPNDDNPPFIVTAINVVEGDTTGSGIESTEFIEGSEHRHGGSPNIFGGFEVVISGGMTEYTFDCETYNPNSGGYPPGLQFSGQMTEVSNPDYTETVDGDGVICISPSSTTKKGNPGEWRQQNGYTGECSTTLFYSLTGPDPIPSNSLPL